MRKEKKSSKRLVKKQLAEKLMSFSQTQPDEAFSFRQIFHALKLTTHPAKMLTTDVTEELAQDDSLPKVGGSAHTLNTKGQVREGTFIRKTNGKNTFLSEDGGTPVFVSERNSTAALNGDQVRVQSMVRRRNHIKEAMVVVILQRKKDTFVGRLRVEKGIAFLVTQESLFIHDILIPKKRLKGGKTDDRVLVKTTKWPDTDRRNLVGEMVDVLGEAGDNGVEMNTVLAQCGLPYKYPKRVEDAAEKVGAKIIVQDYVEREDFRDVWTCTIDLRDMKDLNDALSIRKLENGLRGVGIHIADVSHYVKEGDTIDREAQQRATSVHLVDRTIPMLPERLCNFTCSLRSDEEKPVFSCIFNLNDEANIEAYRIVHTVIKSNRHYAYEEAQQILGDNGVIDGTGEPTPNSGKAGYKGENAEQIITLDRPAKLIRGRRMKVGSVKFDLEELHFDTDEKGKPACCHFKRSKDVNKPIEEFILLANKTVTESVGIVKKGKKAKAFPHRVRDNPDPQKFESLRGFTAKFGYKLKSASTKGATARALNKLIDEVQGRREEKVIQMIALRLMMRVKYTAHNIGHFGLAFGYYTHLTPSIRRYPDTMVHRLITRYQNGGRSANKDHYEELCEYCSDMELVAQSVERDSVRYKMVEFMSEHIGECYDAHISGTQSSGIYAEIDENYCEGMIPVRDLDDDYYDPDEKNYCLVDRRHHHVYQLGDPIHIQVVKADLERRQLDFALGDGCPSKAKQTAAEYTVNRKNDRKSSKRGSKSRRRKQLSR